MSGAAANCSRAVREGRRQSGAGGRALFARTLMLSLNANWNRHTAVLDQRTKRFWFNGAASALGGSQEEMI